MQTQVTVKECDLQAPHLGDVTTVQFSLDGNDYAMEMCDGHGQEFVQTTEPYRLAGRLANAAVTKANRSRTAAERRYAKALRDWATKNHIDLPAHGRIKGDVHQQFRASADYAKLAS